MGSSIFQNPDKIRKTYVEFVAKLSHEIAIFSVSKSNYDKIEDQNSICVTVFDCKQKGFHL